MKRLLVLGLLLLILIPLSAQQGSGKVRKSRGESPWPLEILSPEFRIELDQYHPAYNPAVLGFIDQDRFYFWQVMALLRRRKRVSTVENSWWTA